MKLWSRGLGKTEIDMDLRYYKVIQDAKTGNPTIIGCMQSPVTWEFTIKLEPDDIAGILKVALNVPLLTFAVKNLHRYPVYLMNRDKFKSEDDEHLEERVLATYDQMTSGIKKPKKQTGKSEGSAESQSAASASNQKG